jgi:hypothetical protein
MASAMMERAELPVQRNKTFTANKQVGCQSEG